MANRCSLSYCGSSTPVFVPAVSLTSDSCMSVSETGRIMGRSSWVSALAGLRLRSRAIIFKDLWEMEEAILC